MIRVPGLPVHDGHSERYECHDSDDGRGNHPRGHERGFPLAFLVRFLYCSRQDLQDLTCSRFIFLIYQQVVG